MNQREKRVFQYETNSNAAPFVSDHDAGFIEATDPMAALEEVVRNYKHPCGLFAAVISECTPENPVLARYLSGRAATSEAAGTGVHERKEDGLYVDDKKVPEKNEYYELTGGEKKRNYLAG